jgi:hypothetical protein
VFEGEELDVTSRDDFLLGLQLPSGLATRPTDLLRRPYHISRHSIEIRNGELIWTLSKPIIASGHALYSGAVAREWMKVRALAEHQGRGVLDEFIRLCDSTERDIVAFAKTWGVLELCHHNLPFRHESWIVLPPKYPWDASMKLSLPQPTRQRGMGGVCTPNGSEPVESWRFFSRQAKAMLQIAASLQLEKRGPDAAWSNVLIDPLRPTAGLESQRRCLGEAVNVWLNLGDIQPVIDIENQGLRWGGTDLFGELAVQLALACFCSEGKAFCSVCGREFTPKKRLQPGSVHYCANPRCQKEAAAHRSRRYRQRKNTRKGETRSHELRWRGPFGGRTNDPLFSR